MTQNYWMVLNLLNPEKIFLMLKEGYVRAYDDEYGLHENRFLKHYSIYPKNV